MVSLPKLNAWQTHVGKNIKKCILSGMLKLFVHSKFGLSKNNLGPERLRILLLYFFQLDLAFRKASPEQWHGGWLDMNGNYFTRGTPYKHTHTQLHRS